MSISVDEADLLFMFDRDCDGSKLASNPEEHVISIIRRISLFADWITEVAELH